MIEYLGIIVTFVATFAALRGPTWREGAKGPFALTKIGRWTFGLMFVGMLLSTYTTYMGKVEQEAELARSTQTLLISKSLQGHTDSLTNLANSQTKLIRTLKSNLDSAELMLSALQDVSNHQPQQVLLCRIHLKDIWLAPRRYFSGSNLKLFGFRSPVIVVSSDSILTPFSLHALCARLKNGDLANALEASTKSEYRLDNHTSLQEIVLDISNINGPYDVLVSSELENTLQIGLINRFDEDCDGRISIYSTAKQDPISTVRDKQVMSSVPPRKMK